MAFACCPNCGYVLWGLAQTGDFGRPAVNCPECDWTTYWIRSPLDELVMRQREQMGEAATQTSWLGGRRAEALEAAGLRE